MKPATIVGIDCSLRSAGIAILRLNDDDGVTASTGVARSIGSKRKTTGGRADRIRRQRDRILDHTRGMDLAVIEAPAFASRTPYQHEISWLWGAVYQGLIDRGIPVVDIPPARIKKFVADKGNADKTAVAAELGRMWPRVPTPHYLDEWDALGAATCAAVHYRWPVPFTVLERHRLAISGTEWP